MSQETLITWMSVAAQWFKVQGEKGRCPDAVALALVDIKQLALGEGGGHE